MTEQTQQVPNRRMRRAIQKQNGILKLLKKLGYNHPAYRQFKKETMEAGRKIHQANVDRIDELNATRLEAVLQSCKSTWFGMGYNQEEVALLEEAWAMTAVKDKETYKADKKKARELQREAAALMAARNNQ
jgi:hypothetical protein